MAKWKPFDIKDPPSGWCLVTMRSLAREANILAVVARWSPTCHAWLDVNLTSIPGSYQDVVEFMSLPYESLHHFFTGSPR